MELLLSNGAATQCLTSYNNTPLQFGNFNYSHKQTWLYFFTWKAAENNQIACAKILIKYGADINFTLGKCTNGAIHVGKRKSLMSIQRHF